MHGFHDTTQKKYIYIYYNQENSSGFRGDSSFYCYNSVSYGQELTTLIRQLNCLFTAPVKLSALRKLFHTRNILYIQLLYCCWLPSGAGWYQNFAYNIFNTETNYSNHNLPDTLRRMVFPSWSFSSIGKEIGNYSFTALQGSKKQLQWIVNKQL